MDNEERHKILNMISRECPKNFPEELKPYWKNFLEFSFTPQQTGFNYIKELKTNNLPTKLK